jgi:hypothetical protein
MEKLDILVDNFFSNGFIGMYEFFSEWNKKILFIRVFSKIWVSQKFSRNICIFLKSRYRFFCNFFCS